MIRLLESLLQLILGVVEVLLTFRFLLKLLAANQAAPFVRWIYETSDPLLQPFIYAFPTPSVRGGYALEFTTLFAIFAYAFAGYLIQELIVMIESGSRKRRK